MKISFIDFWSGFNINNNFFSNLLGDSITIVSPEKADIIIYSCFGDSHYKFSSTKKIFYTGECIIPNYNECDFSFSFEEDSTRNIRLPLWYMYIDWFNVGTYTNPEWLIPMNYLHGKNEFYRQKNKFCSTVFSKPIDIRFDMINKLDSYKKVDCYGKLFENKIGEGEKIKIDIISDYKFNLCFENKNHKGYYTEKILHAKIAGCIPIYYSNECYVDDFNPACCMNLVEYKSMDTMVEEIIRIDMDGGNEIAKEPLFISIPSMVDFKNKIMDNL